MVGKELVEARNEGSNRRSFLRRALGFSAAAGAATLLLSRDKSLIPLAQAGSGTGATVNIDEVNYGVGETDLRSTTTDGAAFCGWASASSGNTYGVHGQSDSTNGRGVYGYATASSGVTYGLHGRSDSTSGRGVYGYAFATSGSTQGVYGQSMSPNGTGVYGFVTISSGSNQGVYGQSNSWSGVGVQGVAASKTGSCYGVWGHSQSTDGVGVGGRASSTSGTNYGVYGESWSSSGVSVIGKAVDPGAKPMVAQGTSGQTANLHEWQNNVGTALSVVDKDGKIGAGTTTPQAAIHGNSPSGYGVKGSTGDGSHYGVWGDNPLGIAVEGCGACGVEGNSFDGIGVQAVVQLATGKPIVAKGASGQTANLQEWQNSVGTALSAVDKDGKLGVGTSSPIYGVDVKTGTVGPFRGGSSPPGSAPNSMIFENLVGAGNVKNQLTFKGNGANKYSFGNDISGDGSQNFFIWDEVGAEAVLYIDGARRVGLGTLSPNATAKLHVAGRVRATGYDTGDIRFANDYSVTEDEKDGVAFLNPDRDKIAVLDRQGNLYIKGEVRNLRDL